MQEHLGRLIDHVHIIVADIAASRRFYEAFLGALGHSPTSSGADFFAYDELFVSDGTHPGVNPTPTTRLHLAFQASDQPAVDRAYHAGLAAGGRDNGAPGLRRYHASYYAAFLLDPDGHNIEAVHHGPALRSAASVTVDRD
jgi:catechol 2,3-dioxygenase-like lactoylglutathione lyase family enzyme